MGELQLIRQEILRSSACSCAQAAADATSIILQQAERHRCWAASASLAESCQELWSEVKSVKLQSQDKVLLARYQLSPETVTTYTSYTVFCCQYRPTYAAVDSLQADGKLQRSRHQLSLCCRRRLPVCDMSKLGSSQRRAKNSCVFFVQVPTGA